MTSLFRLFRCWCTLLGLLGYCMAQSPTTFTPSYTTYQNVGVTTSYAQCASTNCLVSIPVETTLTQISVGMDATKAGVDANHKIWFYNRATKTWLDYTYGAPTPVQVVVVDASNLYTLSSGGWVRKFDTAAHVWNVVTTNHTNETMKNFAVAPDSGDVWAIHSTQTYGCGNKVYHLVNGVWQGLNKGLSNITAGMDGFVFGVCSSIAYPSDNIFARNPDDTFTLINGNLKQISIGADNSIYGVNYLNNLYHLGDGDGGTWQLIKGTVKYVAVGKGDAVYALSTAATNNVQYYPAFLPVITNVIQGSTTCSGTGCGPFSASHTATGSVNFGSAVVTQTRTVLWSAYLSLSTTSTAAPAFQAVCNPWDSDGYGYYPCTAESDSSVDCPVMGNLLNVSGPAFFDFWQAFTKLAFNGTRSNCVNSPLGSGLVCDNGVYDWCTPGTSPPDYYPKIITDNTSWDYWIAFGECFRMPFVTHPVCVPLGLPNPIPGPNFGKIVNAVGSKSNARVHCTKDGTDIP